MRYQWQYGPATISNEDGLPDVIMDIAWICVGFDDSNGTNYKASGSVSTPPVDPEHFVPFDQISKSQVESWVFAVVDKSAVEMELLMESQQQPDVKSFNF